MKPGPILLITCLAVACGEKTQNLGNPRVDAALAGAPGAADAAAGGGGDASRGKGTGGVLGLDAPIGTGGIADGGNGGSSRSTMPTGGVVADGGGSSNGGTTGGVSAAHTGGAGGGGIAGGTGGGMTTGSGGASVRGGTTGTAGIGTGVGGNSGSGGQAAGAAGSAVAQAGTGGAGGNVGSGGMGGSAGASSSASLGGNGGVVGTGGSWGEGGGGGTTGSGGIPSIVRPGTTYVVRGSCNVAWYNLETSSSGSCSYAIVSSLSGQVNLEATIDLVAEGDGVGALIDIQYVFPIGPIGVTFPGYAQGSYPTHNWRSPPKLVLNIGNGRADSVLLGAGLCGGACSGQTEPHAIRYDLVFDDVTRNLSLGISGNLPTNSGPAPGVCWFNRATLQCAFSEKAPQ